MKKTPLSRLLFLVSIILFIFPACSPEPPPAKPVQVETETKQAEQKTELIDINTASKQELMSLPGIGEIYAQKIIDNRPYKMKTQLRSKEVVPQGTYDKISDRIIAKQ